MWVSIYHFSVQGHPLTTIIAYVQVCTGLFTFINKWLLSFHIKINATKWASLLSFHQSKLSEFLLTSLNIKFIVKKITNVSFSVFCLCFVLFLHVSMCILLKLIISKLWNFKFFNSNFIGQDIYGVSFRLLL